MVVPSSSEHSLPIVQPVPVVVGVVGHRDLVPGDIARLSETIRTVLAGIRAEFDNCPAILLSALAEGADRLVARNALELGYELISVLPMAAKDYIEDFPEDESRREFESLLYRSTRVITIPGEVGELNEPRADSLHRALQYRRLSAYLASTSHIMIALWDGVDSDLIGGTYDAVRMKVGDLDELEGVEDTGIFGPVYHILTPRISSPLLPSEPYTVHVLFREGVEAAVAARRHRSIVDHLVRFNRDLAGDLGTSAQRHDLVTGDALSKLPQSLAALNSAFMRTDRLAQYFKAKTLRALSIMLSMAFIALFCFEMYAYYYSHLPWILLFYLLPILTAYIVHIRARRRDYQNKYLDYRALAEGLRIQFVWDYVGLGIAASDRYLRMQHTDLDWIRHALRAWHLRGGTMKAEGQTREAMDVVIENWLRPEINYYGLSATRDEYRLNRLRKSSDWLFGGGMGLAAIHVVMQLTISPDPYYPLLITMSLFLILAGLMVLYQDQRGYAMQAKQFARMHNLFDRACRRIEALEIVRELGAVTLVENADWVLLHRDRPLEVPKLG
jgi:hypothetical protein